MKISSLGTDAEKEVNGVWYQMGEGAKLLVARAGNEKYTEAVRIAIKPHQNRLRRGTLPVSVMEEITVKAMSKHIILDWEGILDDDDNDIVYSPDKAVELMNEFPEFREIISSVSTDFDQYRREDVETSLEN